MPRYVGNNLIAKVHVVDANGDPVTGATVNVRFLTPYGVDWDGEWSADNLGYGVYGIQIQPDQSGDWTAIFSCANPKFSKAIIYHVNYPHSFQAPLTGMNNIVDPTVGWHVLFQQFNEDYVQRKIYFINLIQTNNENASKFVDILFNLDSVMSINKVNFELESGVEYFFQLIPANANYDFELVSSKRLLLRTWGQDDNGNQEMGMPLECRNYSLQLYLRTEPGTSQAYEARIMVARDYGAQEDGQLQEP